MNNERMRKLAGLEETSVLSEGYAVVPPIDRESNPDREAEGLEGPYRTKSGLVYYYDKKAGKYYNPKTDMYLEVSELEQHNESENEMNFDRFRKLAGLELVMEAKADVGQVDEAKKDDYRSPEKLYALYVGKRGSGELGIEFTGTREECLSQWHDDLKRSYKRGEAVFRVVPVDDNAPNVIAEAAESETPKLDHKEENKGSTVKVPKDVSAAISARVAELKSAMGEHGDAGGAKANAVDALEKIADTLKQEDGLDKANLFYGTLMSPITDLFPPKVVKFLHTAPAKKVTESSEDGEKGECDYCGSKDGYRMPGGAFQCERCHDDERPYGEQ